MVKSISNQGLLSERDTPVLVITLRHSEKRNTLSLEKLVALSAEIESFANDTTLRVLVIKAEGPVFSAGHDLNEINNGTSNDHIKLFDQCAKTMDCLLYTSPSPRDS